MKLSRFDHRLIFWVGVLLGIQYCLGGINWWFKIFPFPSLSDPVEAAGKHPVLVEMIKTGWMFYAAKVIELLTGIALLTRRYVPLMLVASFPVALSTFMLDAMIVDDLVAWTSGQVSGAFMWSKLMDMIFFGGAVLAMQGYLMLSHMDSYRPFLKARESI